MVFDIVSELPGRLRLRCGRNLMTEEEAKEMIDPMLMTEPAEMAKAIKAFKAKKAAK